MTNKARTCRLCGSANLVSALLFERMPRNIQRLLTQEELTADRPIRVEVFRCDICSFVQLQAQLEEDYYDDYLMTASHSAQMQAYQAEQARDFVSRFDLRNKVVMEAGCGDGNFLSHLASAGARVVGVEPSKTYRRLASPRGFPIEDGYIGATRDVRGAPFDGFVSRQVLEHVPLIHDYLQGIRRSLRAGAFGLVEVPSLEKALADRRFYDFFPDHLNYFSLSTLRLALEMNGFDVLELEFGMFDEYNVAIVKNPGTVSLEGIQDATDTLSREIESFIRARKALGETIAIWGAGGKGLSVMSAADVSGVDLLIDSDPNKQGFYAPLSHLKVQSPELLREMKVDAIIVTAMAYRNEILRALKSEFGYEGNVVLLGHHLEIVS
jgi:SAM-dependent methyltransferase